MTLNEKIFLKIAKKMSYVWNGYDTDFSIKIVGNTVVVKNHVCNVITTYKDNDFLKDWCDTIVIDVDTDVIKLTDEEIDYIKKVI